MSEPEDLSGVVRNHFCIGCGACSVAEAATRLRFNPETMMYEPASCGGQAAAAVCPSIQVDFDWLQGMRFPDGSSTSLGVVESIFLAQSTDYERNLKASSGGVIKELLLEYLSHDEVDGAIALSHIKGLLFEPALITQPEQVDGLPGSIYHNVPFDNALRLLSSNEGRYVLVGIPCQLEGIFNFIYRCHPELAERVYASIGLVCGWTYTHHAIKAICDFKGVDFDRIDGIAYRGGGPVGRLCVQTPNARLEVNRRTDLDYIASFDRSFNLPRCHVCIDHISFLSDIVVGDAWLSRTSHTKTGVSIVICRTKKAVEIVGSLGERGSIQCREATEADVVESQSRSLVYGDFAYAYADYLREIGEFCPSMTGPNRPFAILSSRADVIEFHRENQLKVELQRQGRYRRLRWRKLVVDSGKLVGRRLRKRLDRLAGSPRVHDAPISSMNAHVFR